MSNRAIDAVRDFSKTKGSERLLLFMIAEGINKSTGIYRSAISTLMADCNMSESWVHKLITKLIQRGELIVFDNPGHSSDFAIPIYEGELGYDPQPCDGVGHTCTHRHTSLSVDRETIRRQDWAAQRRQQRTSRKSPRVDDSTPPTENAPEPARGVLEYTPGCIGVHPRVDGSTPPGVSEYTQYPSSTPLDLPLDVPGASPQKKLTGTEKTDGAETAPTPPLPPSPPEWEPGDMEPSRLWGRVVATLQRVTPAPAMASWIYPARIARYGWDADGTLCVEVATPGQAHADMIDRRYSYLIADALARVYHVPASRVAVSLTWTSPTKSLTHAEVAP